jgi:hypothetical protein
MSNENSYYRRHSIFGPLVLVGIGVLLLLRNMGVIPSLGWWFSRYWPVLLIVWGVTKLLEQIWARQKGYAAPGIGAGGVVFLVFFIMIGLGASKARNVNWSGLGDEINFGDDNFFGMFGGRYEFTNTFSQTIEPGKQVKIMVGRGDLSVTPSPDDQTHVVVHKVLATDSESSAKGMNDATNPKFELQGNVWLLDMTNSNFTHGRFNVDLEIPKNFPVALVTRRGDIHVSDRGGNVDMESNRGNISAENIKGNTTLQLERGNATVKHVDGNVTVGGSVRETEIADITGTLALNGDYWNTTQLSHVAKQVSFKSDRTDLQFASLEGDLTLDRGSLHANSLAGPLHLRTSSKNIDLEQLGGDVQIEDSNAPVELHLKAPLGKIDVDNRRGQIIVDVPENAGFQVDAQSSNGNIESDFDLSINNGRRDATARGTVGKGGPQVRLRTERGTIHIRKE